MEEQTKECTLCGETKPFSEFRKHPSARFGLSPRCSNCLSVQNSAYYQANKDIWKIREAEMRAKDPEGLKKKNRDAATRWRSNPENTRQKRMKYIEKRYGITYDQYEAMEKAQNGLCKICRKPPRRLNENGNRGENLHVDHDHKTGEVRGLLCYQCNSALGYFEDDPEVLTRASSYLKGTLE
jgi:hypothetical protein